MSTEAKRATVQAVAAENNPERATCEGKQLLVFMPSFLKCGPAQLSSGMDGK